MKPPTKIDAVMYALRPVSAASIYEALRRAGYLSEAALSNPAALVAQIDLELRLEAREVEQYERLARSGSGGFLLGWEPEHQPIRAVYPYLNAEGRRAASLIAGQPDSPPAPRQAAKAPELPPTIQLCCHCHREVPPGSRQCPHCGMRPDRADPRRFERLRRLVSGLIGKPVW